MNKPKNYELKKWICSNTIVGLKLHHYQTGVDTSDTDWELIPYTGISRRIKASSVIGLIELRPDWVRVMHPTHTVVREVQEWDNFAKKEKSDLAEFERLKKKFS